MLKNIFIHTKKRKEKEDEEVDPYASTIIGIRFVDPIMIIHLCFYYFVFLQVQYQYIL